MDTDEELQKSKIARFVAEPRPDEIVTVLFPRIGNASGVRVTVHTKTVKGEKETHVVQGNYPSGEPLQAHE